MRRYSNQMKYLTEFRNGEIAQRMAREIHSITTRPWKIMEVCGGQTHSIIKNGIDQMLPAGIEMIHGPGCPVCVTPLELIDKALAIAAQPGVIFCSFGDMLRVPGTDMDLFQVKSAGGDVRVVYSPLDAVELAIHNTTDIPCEGAPPAAVQAPTEPGIQIGPLHHYSRESTGRPQISFEIAG